MSPERCYWSSSRLSTWRGRVAEVKLEDARAAGAFEPDLSLWEALLFKTKDADRPKDEADFTAVLPKLDPSRRTWLVDALRLIGTVTRGWTEWKPEGEGEIDPGSSRDLRSRITEIEPILRTIGAIAVIAGTILVVLQLRVNAKNVRSRNAFDLVAKVIDPSFPYRRHLLYEVAGKHADGDWTGFDRSLQDFEVRNFANVYEQRSPRTKRSGRPSGRPGRPLGSADG